MKILFITVVLLALSSAMPLIETSESKEFKVESLPFVTIGQDQDIQLFGWSFRSFVFYFIRSGVKGYIAGYEGRYDIPKECLDT